MNDEYTNDGYNDVQSRIIGDSGYGETNFSGNESPYLEVYSRSKNVHNSMQKLYMLLTYIQSVCNMVIEMHVDETVKVALVDYLGANNYIIEEAKEKADDIVDKLNTISSSEFNVPDLINNNANNLDDETIKSVEELFKYLDSEAIEVVTSIEKFKDDIMLNFKVPIEECITANNAVQSIVEDCDSLFEDYAQAMADNDEIEINRIVEQIGQKIQNGFNSTEEVDFGFGFGGGTQFNAGIKNPLDSLDLAQDLNNPNLLMVKDNELMSDVEFMQMKETKGKEYAEEYIYTLPKEKRDYYFRLMDI